MAKPLDVLKKIAAVIEPVAPWLATAFGGPLAGAAVNRAIGALNVAVQPNATQQQKVDAIDQAISSCALTPDQLVALKNADLAFQEEMKKADFTHIEQLANLAAQDVQSARQMQVQTKSWLPGALAVFVTLGFFSVLYAMMRFPIPAQAHDALMLMLGSLGAAWTSVVAFYFGSSSDSHRKTELLAQAPPVPK